MKIYTKKGDTGKTVFFGCGLVGKDDCRIEALGAFDELNCVIGVTLSFIDDQEMTDILKKIQNDLFQVGADLIGTNLENRPLPKITNQHIVDMESHIDELEEKLGMPDKFILPGGTKASALLHLCRSTARRAERNLVKSSKILDLNPEMLKYVNRLSDFLYVLARQANKELDIKEQQPIYKYLNEE